MGMTGPKENGWIGGVRDRDHASEERLKTELKREHQKIQQNGLQEIHPHG